MTVENEESKERGEGSHRRHFLQGVGAAGVAGVLAGCLGGDDDGDDENGDANGDDENGDDENGDAEPSFLAVSEVVPGDDTVTRGSGVEITATIENTGDEEGTGDVELLVDGESEATETVTLGGGESDDVFLGEIDTAAFDVGEYDYEVTTDDDEASATLTVEGALGDDPDPLISLADSEVGVGSQTLTASLNNPYAVALEDGTVELEAPDGWSVGDGSGTTFDTLEALDSQDVEWGVEIPSDAGGDYELTAHVTYASASEDADVTTTLSITIDVWEGVEFEEVLHFEDFWDGIEDRRHETDDGETVEGQIEWYEYEADLSAFLPATDVQLLFEDSYPDDGWGPSVQDTTVYADGEEIHYIESATEEEEEYLYEENSQIDDFSEDDDQWRFADADQYWIYQFDVPEDAEELTVEFTMRNGFVISARSIPDNGGGSDDAVSAPYGANLGGELEEEEPQSEVPVEIGGLEFENVEDAGHADEIPYLTLHGEENPDADWFEPPAMVGSEGPEPIEGTDHDALYQTELFGYNLGVELAIENGTYDVTLHQAELWHGEDGINGEGGDGSRVFDVLVQGETVAEEYDVHAAAGGANIADTIVVEGVEVEDGSLLIETETHADFSKIGGIEIREA